MDYHAFFETFPCIIIYFFSNLTLFFQREGSLNQLMQGNEHKLLKS